jgi:hypothetical protein
MLKFQRYQNVVEISWFNFSFKLQKTVKNKLETLFIFLIQGRKHSVRQRIGKEVRRNWRYCQ